jgi:gliding motility-associated-like protein
MFTISTLANNDVVSCTVTSNALCATPATVASNNIVMNLTPLLPTKINILASANNVCKGTPITFTATSTNGGYSPDYQWLVNGAGAGTNGPTFTSDTLSNGDLVTCLLTGNDPCAVPGSIKSDSVSLVIYPLPVVNTGGNKTINKGGQTTLNATASGDIASIAWSPSAGLSSSNTLNPIAIPDTTTTYTLTVQTNAGCVLSASLQVIVLTPISAPTGFTPNGDGVNDTWNIKNLQYYQNSSVQIFDRYGQAVYQSKGYSKPWDGTINGRRLPMGTYYYVILLNNNTPPISGYVTIIR